MQVMDADRLVDRVITEFVGGSVAEPGLHPATGEPESESLGMMTASSCPLTLGRSTELGTPDDQRVLEQTSLFQVGDQPRDRLVATSGVGFVGPLEVRMLVPTPSAATRMSHVHKTYSTLDQPTGQ